MAIKQTKIFKLSNGKPPRKPAFQSVRAEKLKNPEDQPPFYIRGIRAGSKEEWWVSLALDRIQVETGWTWEYQVSVFGGRTRAGGNVVDFLIDTPGMKTFLDPMGRYWHTGAREDRSQMQDVARRKKWRLIAWFTDEVTSREETYAFLRNEMNV